MRPTQLGYPCRSALRWSERRAGLHQLPARPGMIPFPDILQSHDALDYGCKKVTRSSLNSSRMRSSSLRCSAVR